VTAAAVVDGAILAGARGLGLLRSTDGGRSWAAGGPATPGAAAPAFTALLPNPAVTGEVWAGVQGGGVLTSADGGRGWSDVGDGLPSRDVRALAWSSGGVLLAALASDGVTIWRSGRWISSRLVPANRCCLALAARADDAGILYCGFDDGAGGGVALSRDGGRSWEDCDGLPSLPGGVRSVATTADRPELVAAASAGGTVALSHDGTVSWAAVLATGADTRAVACVVDQG
jgi:photosystem II stability/assembly factor-like uncharacterized protein